MENKTKYQKIDRFKIVVLSSENEKVRKCLKNEKNGNHMEFEILGKIGLFLIGVFFLSIQ